MVGYSARLAFATTFTAMVFIATSRAPDWRWSVLLALPLVLFSAYRLVRVSGEWADPEPPLPGDRHRRRLTPVRSVPCGPGFRVCPYPVRGSSQRRGYDGATTREHDDEGHAMSDDILAKVRKILAKAEDPAATPEEAETYTAKAAELVAAYGIDRALLAQTEPGSDVVGDRVVLLDPPYALDKAGLLSSVAYRLRCRAVQRVRYVDGEKQISLHLFGYDSDLVRAEVLCTSLLLQATSTLARTRCRTASTSRPIDAPGSRGSPPRSAARGGRGPCPDPRRVGRDQGQVGGPGARRPVARGEPGRRGGVPLPAQGGRPHAVGQRRTLQVDRRAARRPRRHLGDPTLARAGRPLRPA